ncbi:MAG: hypothetical protein G9473_13925 [Erythrobacter sp.]|nr:MAG: hypothetical protein G9473_13925 [Erythrobacter sp.]
MAGLAPGAEGFAQDRPAPAQAPEAGPTYADLVTLAEASALVIRAEIRGQATVEPERAPGLKPGFARLYLEGETRALLAGNTGVRESLAWLADVPLDAKGKAPKLKKSEVLLFADPVTGRPGTLVLVEEEGMLAWTPALESRVRGVLTELVAPDAPPVITGIADALSVRGNLAGESETQVFLETEAGSPVSISVLRRPGQPPAWGVSWGEIIDSSARPPEPGTLRWYRLACALPRELPSSANLARDPDARALAEADYAFVIERLGACERAITSAE